MPKISQYPSGTAPVGNEILIGDQSGATVTLTPAQLATLASTGLIAVDSGAINAYVLTSAVPPAALTTGQLVVFHPITGNNGPSTLNYNGHGAVAIHAAGNVALVGGELVPTDPALLQFTGGVWQLLATTAAQIVTVILAQFLTTPLDITRGGTGAASVSAALAALGLTVAATLSNPVAIAQGGTGSTTAAAARTALAVAPLASPTFTGVPAGPTAAPGTNTTQLATTAFTAAAVTAVTSGLVIKGAAVALTTGGARVNYPVAFPTATVSVIITAATSTATYAITAIDAAGFNINVGVSETFYYIAAGN